LFYQLNAIAKASGSSGFGDFTVENRRLEQLVRERYERLYPAFDKVSELV
jgi:hypothetical protein